MATRLSGALTAVSHGSRAGAAHGAVPEIRGSVIMTMQGAEKLLASSKVSLEQAIARADARRAPLALEVIARIVKSSRHTAMMSSNALALLQGCDSKLSEEVVVVTAHSDHLGIGEPVDGHRIYYGAVDNTSGTAALIEIAKSLAHLPKFYSVPIHTGGDSMDWQAIGAIGQAVSTLALVFVLIQLRDARRETRRAGST